MRKKLTLVPIIKVASVCNLGCDYCSAEEYMEHHPEALMNDETLNRTITELARVQEKGSFLWHGGEPLLVGIDFYKKAKALQTELGLEDRFRNTMQTNGVLLTDRWTEFFSESSFSIGISIDGPEAMHNELRVFNNGAGSHRQVVRGIERAMDKGLKPGVLVVVTRQSVRHPEKIFSFLVEHGFNSMDFKPCYGSPAHDVSLIDFANFMVKIFDMWVSMNNPDIRVRLLEGFMHNMLGSIAQACSQNGSCVHLITIDHDGTVYPCDRFIEPDYKFGNINETPLDVLYEDSEGANKFRNKVTEQRRVCETCSYQPVCKGGCTQERDYWPEEYCTHREIIIDHIRAWLVEQGEDPVSVTPQQERSDVFEFTIGESS